MGKPASSAHINNEKMKIRHFNRPNKRKQKQGSGCKMCKPWKGRWASRFKDKDKSEMEEVRGVKE